MFIETHCHLDFPEYNLDRDTVIQQAKSEGIEYIINIGSSLEGSIRSIDLAQRYSCVFATVGIHPHEADGFSQVNLQSLEKLASQEKVVAIGEIGLDYFKNYSLAENQKKLFLSLVDLAKIKDLPLVIHTRQAQEDTLSILREAMPIRAVVHCFSGDELFLKECLDLGFFVSFTCNITYKKAQNLRDLVKLVPKDRLMLETDAPFLSPEGFRGKRNEPAHVKIVASEIARIRGESLEEIAEVTSRNAINFFKLQ
ncbi:MAG: TatD family hydrolase [Candidatus Omnitrophica bacterium]|nr:TatD family hydrolase [Candidatus Omnitrophota bacterium]